MVVGNKISIQKEIWHGGGRSQSWVQIRSMNFSMRCRFRAPGCECSFEVGVSRRGIVSVLKFLVADAQLNYVVVRLEGE